MSRLIILQLNKEIKRLISSFPIPRQPPVINIVVSFVKYFWFLNLISLI